MTRENKSNAPVRAPWWLECEVSGLAEEACDGAVLAQGHDRSDDSRYLLAKARSAKESGGPVLGMAMSVVGLSRQIRSVLSGVAMLRSSLFQTVGSVATCLIAATIFSSGTLVRAQSKTVGPRFEVASVRPEPATLGNGVGRIGVSGRSFQRPSRDLMGRVFAYGNSLYGMIVQAYGLKGCAPNPEAAKCAEVVGGPNWMMKDRFLIEAKSPANVADYSAEQFLKGEAPALQEMLRALLSERFGLKLHKETRQLAVFALRLDKKGSKLKAVGVPETITLPDGSSRKNRILAFGRVPGANRAAVRLTVRDRSVAELADAMTDAGSTKIVDQTGLKGTFDFTIDYERDLEAGVGKAPGAVGGLVGVDLFRALQEHLGIKVESTRAPVEVMVIDNASRPGEN